MKGRDRPSRTGRGAALVLALLVVGPLIAGGASAKQRGEIPVFEPFRFASGTYDLHIDRPGDYGIGIKTDPDNPACEDVGNGHLNFYDEDDGDDHWMAAVESCEVGFWTLSEMPQGDYRVEVDGTGWAILVRQHSVNAETGRSGAIEDTFTGRVAHWFEPDHSADVSDKIPLIRHRVDVEASAPVRGWIVNSNITLDEDLGEGRSIGCLCDFWDSLFHYVVLETDAKEPVDVVITTGPPKDDPRETFVLGYPWPPMLAVAGIAAFALVAARRRPGGRRSGP